MPDFMSRSWCTPSRERRRAAEGPDRHCVHWWRSGPPRARLRSRVAVFLSAAGLALGLPAASRAQQAAAPADTLPSDSIFAQAGPVLRWNVASRALIERAIASRGARPARPTFYDGNNNSRLYALVAGAQYDALRSG